MHSTLVVSHFIVSFIYIDWNFKWHVGTSKLLWIYTGERGCLLEQIQARIWFPVVLSCVFIMSIETVRMTTTIDFIAINLFDTYCDFISGKEVFV